MWLVYKEMVDWKLRILYGRDGSEYSLPEVPHFIVDGFCPQTRNVYDFIGCFYHGHT